MSKCIHSYTSHQYCNSELLPTTLTVDVGPEMTPTCLEKIWLSFVCTDWKKICLNNKPTKTKECLHMLCFCTFVQWGPMLLISPRSLYTHGPALMPSNVYNDSYCSIWVALLWLKKPANKLKLCHQRDLLSMSKFSLKWCIQWSKKTWICRCYFMKCKHHIASMTTRHKILHNSMLWSDVII